MPLQDYLCLTIKNTHADDDWPGHSTRESGCIRLIIAARN